MQLGVKIAVVEDNNKEIVSSNVLIASLDPAIDLSVFEVIKPELVNLVCHLNHRLTMQRIVVKS